VSTIAAYEALSEPYQRFLEGLTAVHDFEKSFPRDRFAAPDAARRWEEARAKNPPVTHPVVRTHPASGRKALFVNYGFTTRINELSRAESDAVLAHLFAHVTRPEFQVRHRWRKNDLALWDNRVTQHYAAVDYLPERRIMHRATIGERPVYQGDTRRDAGDGATDVRHCRGRGGRHGRGTVVSWPGACRRQPGWSAHRKPPAASPTAPPCLTTCPTSAPAE
jgi:hypothetical protein